MFTGSQVDTNLHHVDTVPISSSVVYNSIQKKHVVFEFFPILACFKREFWTIVSKH